MKNLFALLSIAGLVMFAAPQVAMAQAEESAATEVAAYQTLDDAESMDEEAVADIRECEWQASG